MGVAVAVGLAVGVGVGVMVGLVVGVAVGLPGQTQSVSSGQSGFLHKPDAPIEVPIISSSPSTVGG